LESSEMMERSPLVPRGPVASRHSSFAAGVLAGMMGLAAVLLVANAGHSRQVGVELLAHVAGAVSKTSTVATSLAAALSVPEVSPCVGSEGQTIFLSLDGPPAVLAALETSTSSLASSPSSSSGSDLTCSFQGAKSPAIFDHLTGKFLCRAPKRPSASNGEVKVDVLYGPHLVHSFLFLYAVQNHVDDATVMKIDLASIGDNVKRVTGDMPSNVRMCAVVKNQQPVGPIAKAMADAGHKDYFGVRGMVEARELRKHGVKNPVLLMYDQDPTLAPEMLHLGAEPNAVGHDWIATAEKALAGSSKPLPVHLWVDTGLTREGVAPEEAQSLALRIAKSPKFKLVGVATHFCCSGYASRTSKIDRYDPQAMRAQTERFDQVLAQLHKHKGLMDGVTVHAGASGVYSNPDLHYARYNMLRLGRVLFQDRENFHGLVYKWSTEVRGVKTLPRGWCIDYGCSSRLQRDTRVAMLPGNDAPFVAYHKGKKVEVLLDHGYISTLDVTDHPDIKTGTRLKLKINDEDHRHWLAGEPVAVVALKDSDSV